MFDATTGIIRKLTGASPIGPQPRNQRMPFMFEVQDADGSLYGDLPGVPGMATPRPQFIFPIAPEAYRMGTMPRSTVTMTQAGAFVDRTGVAPVQISLSGTFGFLGEMSPNVKAQYDYEQRDGYALFKDLEEQFLTFYLLFGTHDQFGDTLKRVWDPAKPPRLCFFNFTDKHYYVVQITRFDLNRSIQRRFIYQYDIQMTGLNKIQPHKDADAFEKYYESSPTKPDTSTMDNFDAAVSWIKSGFNAVKSVRDGLVQLAGAVQGDMNTLTSAVQEVQTTATSIIQAPFSMVHSVINGIDQMKATMESLGSIPDQIRYNLNECKRDALSLSLYPESRFLVTGTASSLAQKAIRTESVMFNDSIRSLASRALGDANKWTQIAQVNKLEYPFIVTDPADALVEVIGSGHLESVMLQGSTEARFRLGIATNWTDGTGNYWVDANGNYWSSDTFVVPQVGQTVLVTTTDGNLIATVVKINADGTTTLDKSASIAFPAGSVVVGAARSKRVLLPGEDAQIPGDPSMTFSVVDSPGSVIDRMMGIDEQIVDGSQSTGATGDFATISGYDNLIMQLEHRLNTRIGELAELGHPAYGCNLPDLIGEAGTDYIYERCLHEAEIAILADPRVDSVQNMKFDIQNTAVYLSCDIIPKHQTSTVSMNILVG